MTLYNFHKSNGEISIAAWVHEVIEGPGGMNEFERHELVSWFDEDRVAGAKWVLRCLANPGCEGSQEVLDAILLRRAEVEARDKEKVVQWQRGEPLRKEG